MNRIARELVGTAGGAVEGERCLPLGSTDVDGLVADIARKRPDFVLSNLLGPSSHAFLEAYAALGQADPDFAPEIRPVVSCNLADVDLADVGSSAIGHITTSVYFDTRATPDNAELRQRVSSRFYPNPRPSS